MDANQGTTGTVDLDVVQDEPLTDEQIDYVLMVFKAIQDGMRDRGEVVEPIN